LLRLEVKATILKRASIAGFEPGVSWAPNPGAQRRTIAEAMEIAKRNGVDVPVYLHFTDDPLGLLAGKKFTARGPQITKPAGGSVTWADHIDPRTGKIVIRVRADILESDEAIVAVFTHETYEFRELRQMLQESGGRISIEDYI
jgi:hypothetical protein